MRMKFLVCLLTLLTMTAAHVFAAASAAEPQWLAPTLGPLSPSIHFNGAVGDSSGDLEALQAGHHDPTREDGTVQGLEFGLSLRLDQLEGFAVYRLGYGAEEEWEDGWEEAFLKIKDLPGGFEIRGGRMLSRFGKQNPIHLHAWQFVDMPLVVGRFLGDDGLSFDGGDLTWLNQGINSLIGVTVGYGEAKSHDHDHAHGDEDHDEDEAHHDDHDDHTDHDDDHEHEHAEHDHEGEALFADDVTSGRLFYQYRADDFRSYELGLSVAVGDDETSRQIAVYGADFSYTWRENGLEPGGRALTWLTEVLYRDVEDGGSHGHEDEHEDHADDDDHDEHADHDEDHDDHGEDMLYGDTEFGLYSQVIYTVNQHLDVAGRIGYLEGSEKLGSDERVRISPAVTAYLDPYRRASLRVQYNYDDLPMGEEEHTVWVQLGLSWGGTEVR